MLVEQEIEPAQDKSILSHQVLIILLSAITPNDGDSIATMNAATIDTDEKHRISTPFCAENFC